MVCLNERQTKIIVNTVVYIYVPRLYCDFISLYCQELWSSCHYPSNSVWQTTGKSCFQFWWIGCAHRRTLQLPTQTWYILYKIKTDKVEILPQLIPWMLFVTSVWCIPCLKSDKYAICGTKEIGYLPSCQCLRSCGFCRFWGRSLLIGWQRHDSRLHTCSKTKHKHTAVKILLSLCN